MTNHHRNLAGVGLDVAKRLVLSSHGHKSKLWSLLLLLTFYLSGDAQDSLNNHDMLTSDNEISLKLIMSDQDWLGRQPQNAYWGDLSENFYYSQKRPGVSINDLYRANKDNNEPATLVSPEHAAKESVPGGVWRYDADLKRFSEKVYIRNGDVYHRDLLNGQINQLTRTTSSESQPVFINDASIGFRRNDKFFIRNLKTGLEYEPFPFVFTQDPAEKKNERYQGENVAGPTAGKTL